MQNGQNAPDGVLCVLRVVRSARKRMAFAIRWSALKATAPHCVLYCFNLYNICISRLTVYNTAGNYNSVTLF